MDNFLFVLTRGLEDPTRVTRAFQMAKAAKENGYNVNVFLTDDAVVLIRPGMLDNVVAPTGDEAAAHFQFLLEKKVPIHLCTPCAVARQVKEDEVTDPVLMSGAPKLLELAKEATVLTF